MRTTDRRGFMPLAARASLAGAIAGLVLALAGCNGGSSSSANRASAQFNIGGAVSGLGSGQSVVLEVNGAAPLTMTANGPFAFTDAVAANGAYTVTVTTQPTGQVCTVSNGSGSGVTANITNVAVTCSTDTYTISGQVSGLTADTQVVLKNNGADALTVSNNGSFTFATPVAFNGSYAVTVATQPLDATCSVSMGSGAGVTANVSNVAVICAVNSFPIGGTLAGLATSAQVTLENNDADALTLNANGAFTFPTQVAAGGAYNVTVSTQPVGATCTVSNGQGSNLDSDISDVSVTCSANTYTIGGSVSGLAAIAQVTLKNNGADPLTVSANGPFTFDTPVAYDGSYAVTVGTEPTDQSCVVSAGSGANVSANVTNVSVTCVTTTFTTPGSYSFTVPDGVTSLQIVATGGGGGGSGASGAVPGNSGGDGAVVTSIVAVTTGQVLPLVVGGGGGGGTSDPINYGYGGAGGGGGGATSLDAGSADQIIAGGGGGGGAVPNADGGNAGGTDGAGGAGGIGFNPTAAAGGAGGIGGAGANDGMGSVGGTGGNGNGGPGAAGSSNPPWAGGSAGSSSGLGSGGTGTAGWLGGGGGGGYGGGGGGVSGSGGGGGGSTGPSGTTYGAASNGGGQASSGGNGSIVITLQ